MAFLQFIIYVVIFFGVSTITQIVYGGVKKSYRFDEFWVGPSFAIITIVFWMTVPTHWIVVVFFATTTGIAVSEKGKIKPRKLF